MKNAVALWVIFITITFTLLLYIQTGFWLSTEFVIVSIPAMICWLRFSAQNKTELTIIVPLYILAIACYLLLSTARYSSGYAAFLNIYKHGLFKQSFLLDDSKWFLIMVCVPVSIMLAGGYMYIKRLRIGTYIVWWTFIFCIVESIIQYDAELHYIKLYVHQYYLGVFISITLFLLSAYGLLALLKHSRIHNSVKIFEKPDQRKINLWSVLFVTLVILYGTTIYIQAGLLPVGIVAGSMMGGMIGWRKTTSKRPADPYKLVPLYLLLLALFYIHVGEESLTHFNQSIAAISGHSFEDAGFNYLFALVGPVVWVFAAWSLWKGQPFGNYILWFMIVGMIIGEPTHILLFPVVRIFKERVGYEYFSGMYTSLFPMIPAIIALTVILKDHKTVAAARE